MTINLSHTVVTSDTDYDNCIKFSPSELPFVNCPYLLWLSKRMGIKPPIGVFPAVFRKIDGAAKEFFEGKSPKLFDKKLFDGKIYVGGKIQSKIFRDTLSGLRYWFSGIPDFIIVSDCKKRHGVIDDKCADPSNSRFLESYFLQVCAYRWCLMFPRFDKGHQNVDTLGIHVTEPSSLIKSQDGLISYKAKEKFIPFAINDKILEDKMSDFGKIIRSDYPPEVNTADNEALWNFVKAESLVKKKGDVSFIG